MPIGHHPSLESGFRKKGGGAPHERDPQAVPDLVGQDSRFDSTRGFPGEGPDDRTSIPWFLAATTTRGLVDGKRRRLQGDAAAIPSTVRRLDFRPALRRASAVDVISGPGRADMPWGRGLQAHKDRAAPKPHAATDLSGTTPVPRFPFPQHRHYRARASCGTLRIPCPPSPQAIPCAEPSLDTSGGYMAWARPPSRRFGRRPKVATTRLRTRTSSDFTRIFVRHSQASKFHPMGIRPGDLVGFLRREHERGAAHPTRRTDRHRSRQRAPRPPTVRHSWASKTL